jgi:hypothetical protein
MADPWRGIGHLGEAESWIARIRLVAVVFVVLEVGGLTRATRPATSVWPGRRNIPVPLRGRRSRRTRSRRASAAARPGIVFEKFGRVTGGAAKPGTGLGLFVARSIGEAHGGTLELASTPGEGATFAPTLPTDSRE